MAPKKQQPKQNKQKPKKAVSSSSGPRLQISAQNESRLRRLLLNSGQTPAPVVADDSLSRAQKVKRLRSIYEKLSCEGFADEQIELALSVLKDGATFEDALDWLCLNLPSGELPLKFSSGTSSHHDAGGSVSVISYDRKDWNSSVETPASQGVSEMPEMAVMLKCSHGENSLDMQRSQADWIRRYVEQQEEDELDSWEDSLDGDSSKQVSEPRSYEVISKEYHDARLDALRAKEKGDKELKERSGHVIRKLKQELAILGISFDILASSFESERASLLAIEDSLTDFVASKVPEAGSSYTTEDVTYVPAVKLIEDKKCSETCGSDDSMSMPVPQNIPGEQQKPLENDKEDVELGDFFSEEAISEVFAPPEKTRKITAAQTVDTIDGVWKKGDPRRIPKAVLHQLCQRSGWDAPKFYKMRAKDGTFFYTVSVLRKASGRGKTKKAGGLITLQLPDQDKNKTFTSVEDAQNRVAAFALHQLFPDLPVHLLITDPYASLVIQWLEGESSSKLEEAMEDRRAEFVDQLLNGNDDISADAVDQMDSLREESHQNPLVEEQQHFPDVYVSKKLERSLHLKLTESRYLRLELEKKKKQQKYKDMLETRDALPIAAMKNEILQLLNASNVLVVCGETGSGKTTQVPQFILDAMIESECGGECNIICTQPRRIAAISVAERVADERCEPSPGMDGSLVGYHVRLDSARNEKTKLLFCTTGILLRMIAGDKSLNDITHVIVDEVHERSLLGDFLLIVLKDIIERQETTGRRKLKVVLMSATVDSNLFSRYFNDCPVVFAKGRTHPVTTYFLEDIYDSINYRLDSDSPASVRSSTFTKQDHHVSNHRGKKNLVLSGWGDDSVLSEASVNPYYDPEVYQSYSHQTQQNLKNLNEDVIDYDLLEDLVCYVDETCAEGAILVFLPGVSEINMLYDKLAASFQFSGQSSDWLLPLHSSVAAADQRKVFQRPPENIRKVIIATNIAETSITIDDVVYVIDCGKHKENRYNPQKKLSSMVEDWISQANARQRRGRAGRVKPGVCYSMYTRARYERHMRPFQVPEMQRMPLVELCLQIKLVSLGNIHNFLSKALESPKEEAVASAIQLLYEVGALEGDEELTPLGYHLAKLPVDVLIGKMLIYGGIFGCLSPILSVSAFLSYKSPFVYPKDERNSVERAKMALLADKQDTGKEINVVDAQSDHIIMMVAYKKWEKIMREAGVRAAQQFCNTYFLSSPVMYMIREMRVQFGTLLADIGLIRIPRTNLKPEKDKERIGNWLSDHSQPFNKNSHLPSVVKSILCAGLYPNIAATEAGLTTTVLSTLKRPTVSWSGDRPWWYDGRREVHIHPSSINSTSRIFKHPFVVFLEKVETKKVYLRDTTVISPYSVLLFGGSMNVQHQTGAVTIDGWMKINAAAQTAVLFKQLRLTLHSVLKEMIRHPEKAGAADNEVVKSIVHLLLEEDQPSQ